MRYFVTAIDTDSGKTLASAVLATALGADYWKPVQSGEPTDSDTIRRWLPEQTIHPEAYKLQLPASPHMSAAAEGVEIRLADIQVPETSRPLVIEGAGGCLVPLNQEEFVVDLAGKLQAEVVLVSNFYLGSINHTLLTAELLKQRGYSVRGIIFNGPHNPASEQIILKHTGWRKLLYIPQLDKIDAAAIRQLAEELKAQW
jgi:dethiobiotin synthetase